MSKNPKINIPPHRLETFNKLSVFDDDQMNLIYEALRKVPKGVNRKGFSDALSKMVEIEGISEIADGIFSFGTIRFDTSFSADQIAESLVESFKRSHLDEESDTPFNEDIFNRLEERLRLLILSCDTLKPFFDALQIVSDNGNVLQNSQLSFHVNLLPDDVKNSHVFIHHKLKISFESIEEDSSQHVYSLDAGDLIKLKSQIEQALIDQNNFIKNNPHFILVDPTE
jgi:hypothetical protein